MEPISDLLRLGRVERCTLGVEAATIPRDRYDFGMLFQPFGEALDCPDPEEDQSPGAGPDLPKSFRSPGPCAKPNYLRPSYKRGVGSPLVSAGRGVKRCHRWWRWRVARGGAGLEDHPRRNRPGDRFPKRAPFGARYAFAIPAALTENLAWAGKVATTKAARGRPQLDRSTLPGKILEAARIGTVPGSRNFAAARTDWLLLNMNEWAKPVLIPFDAVQDEHAWVWKKGLRMARGRCRRSYSLKHFLY
jgi:hypothetical protein